MLGLREQLTRSLRIEWDVLQFRRLSCGAGWQQHICGLYGAFVDLSDELLPVKGHGNARS